jgi:H+-transporting ATPase
MDAPGKADAKDDLKSLSMLDLLARSESSPDGLSQAEAQRRLAHYGLPCWALKSSRR